MTMAAVSRMLSMLKGRRAVIISLAALWMVVTAVGAGGPADDDAWLGMPGFGWLTYVFVAMLVLGGLVIIAAAFLGVKEGDAEPEPRKPIWPLLLVILIFVLLSQRRSDSPEEAIDTPPPPPAAVVEPAEGSGRTGQIGRDEIGVLLLILAAALGVMALSRRAIDELTSIDGDETLEETLTPAVERAAQHLSLGDDPRTAVLLAYSGLEAALSGKDRARAPNETPTEHLERALTTLSVTIDTEPLLRLAELYQVARFSTHPITVAQQQQAADSLHRVRSQLAATA